jgi:outer membrane protein OmpA-like peptidoglycan-associated protein/opacity protein-like surface antigen
MIKYLRIFALFLFILQVSSANAQSSKYGWLAKSSWSVGFGGSYPRYISTNLSVENELSYGGYLSVQRNFSEHVALRFGAYYFYLEGRDRTPPASNLDLVMNNIFSGNFDLLYYLIPCEPVSPYLNFGLGMFHFSVENEGKPQQDRSHPSYQFNLGIGAEWRLSENWKVKSELVYHSPATSRLDSEPNTEGGGILGGHSDTYISFDLGFMHYFAYGEKSNLCELYDGINKEIVDYGKIEEIVKKYQTKPTDVDYNRIDEIVKKYRSAPTSPGDNWVLIGANFDFNKSTLKPEAYPVLYNAAEILLLNPDIKVEVQGHTDNIGSESYNQTLSLERAETVRNFLISKGISANRLMAKGYGESNPISDNSSPQGRELNRRIEFKVIK